MSPRPIPAISFSSRPMCRTRRSMPQPTKPWNACWCAATTRRDRKSTRLNSSHVSNSYAVFCLKKKTGPTGSGKTTTLYAALSEIKSIEDKIITIEDPVEYQLKGITQIPINEKKGLTFARGLRSILRHDPDKIMVGEIRDAETAQIAINSALTGHL